VTKKVEGSIACNNASFGDPFGGVVKVCKCNNMLSVNQEDNINMEPRYQLVTADKYGNTHDDFPQSEVSSLKMTLTGDVFTA